LLSMLVLRPLVRIRLLRRWYISANPCTLAIACATSVAPSEERFVVVVIIDFLVKIKNYNVSSDKAWRWTGYRRFSATAGLAIGWLTEHQ
jgi:hypothetical protein